MSEKPNRILEFLTAPLKPEGEACRSNRRRRTSASIELSWPDGGNWRTIRARLRNISRGGAGLVAAAPPPLTRRARLRLIEGEGTPWIEAEILAVEPEPPKRQKVRVRFIDPCPSFMLRLAVLGFVEAEDEGPAKPCEWVAWAPEMAE